MERATERVAHQLIEHRWLERSDIVTEQDILHQQSVEVRGQRQVGASGRDDLHETLPHESGDERRRGRVQQRSIVEEHDEGIGPPAALGVEGAGDSLGDPADRAVQVRQEVAQGSEGDRRRARTGDDAQRCSATVDRSGDTARATVVFPTPAGPTSTTPPQSGSARCSSSRAAWRSAPITLQRCAVPASSGEGIAWPRRTGSRRDGARRPSRPRCGGLGSEVDRRRRRRHGRRWISPRCSRPHRDRTK